MLPKMSAMLSIKFKYFLLFYSSMNLKLSTQPFTTQQQGTENLI